MKQADEIGWSPSRSPLDRLLRRVGLVRGDPHDTRRVILAFVACAWLPFGIVGLVVGLAEKSLDPLFRNPAVHARLLIAIPAFLLANRVFSSRTSVCVRRLLDGRLIPQESMPAFGMILQDAARRRDSPLAEAAMLLASLGVGQSAVWYGRTGLIGGITAELSAGLVWYGFVSLPIFLFLLLRSIWRWGCWSHFLWRISRLPLQLVSMHADRAGGLGFLIGPSLAVAVVLLGSSSVISAGFAERMVSAGDRLVSFGPEFFLLLVIGEILALGPLLVFSPKLVSTRFIGVEQYGALGIDYSRDFHRRWIESGATEDLLGTPDIQSLADYQGAYQSMEKMRPAPFSSRELVLVGLAVLLPMLPLLAIELPIEELLARLASAIA